MYLLLKSRAFSSLSHGGFLLKIAKRWWFFLGFPLSMKKLGFFPVGYRSLQVLSQNGYNPSDWGTGNVCPGGGWNPPWDPPLHRLKQVKCRGIFSAKILSPDLSPKKGKPDCFFELKTIPFFRFFFLMLSFGGVVEEVEMSWGDFSGVITWLVSSGEWSVFEKLFNSLMISRVSWSVVCCLYRLFRASPDWWNFSYPLFLAENWPLHAVSNASTVDVGSNHGERRCLGICPS